LQAFLPSPAICDLPQRLKGKSNTSFNNDFAIDSFKALNELLCLFRRSAGKYAALSAKIDIDVPILAVLGFHADSLVLRQHFGTQLANVHWGIEHLCYQIRDDSQHSETEDNDWGFSIHPMILVT
jgi:hypothetical protein